MNDDAYQVVFNDYPHAFGRPALKGCLRMRPEDFRVDEVLGFSPDGEGPHLMLWVEKTGANTEWVARQFARIAGCRAMDVGFCGMKDRHAVTRQWFSVPVPSVPVEWQAVNIEGVQVLEVHAHRRKLRRGAHAANRFELTVRELSGHDDLSKRVARIAVEGVPNYFGQQRFGPRGDNVVRAMRGARGGIYLSATRSYLFNEVLAERVRRGDWNALLHGEAVQLDGSGSFFVADVPDSELQRRLADFDIHPSGPMWGKGELSSRLAAAELEAGIANEMPNLTALLEAARMRQERRALRLPVRELWPEKNSVVIAFQLPPGAFATSVMRELVNTSEAHHA